MFVRNLAEAYPQGIKLDGAIGIKIRLFCDKMDSLCGKGKKELFEKAFKEFANVTAKQAFDYPEGDIIDRTESRMPGKYLLKRPFAVMECLKQLGNLYNECDRPGNFLTAYDKSDFESLTLEIEQDAWEIGRKAKRIEI